MRARFARAAAARARAAREKIHQPFKDIIISIPPAVGPRELARANPVRPPSSASPPWPQA
jgi:hypothetical protein